VFFECQHVFREEILCDIPPAKADAHKANDRSPNECMLVLVNIVTVGNKAKRERAQDLMHLHKGPRVLNDSISGFVEWRLFAWLEPFDVSRR
jgi:hypothetical protein